MILASADFGLSYILEIVALVFVAYVVWKYVWAGGLDLRGRMNDYAAGIATQLEAGDEARRQAEELVTKQRDALKLATEEAETTIRQAELAAAEVVAEGGRRADDDYRRIVQRAEVQIEGALARVRAEVLAEASQIIVRAVEAVIEAELDGTSHHRLIGEAISATEAEAI